jgi:hypothetical protein
MLIAAGAAVAATVSGMGVLYAAWRQRFAGKALALWGGWTLLLLAMYAWTRAAGTESGIVLGLAAPAIAAWLFIVPTARQRRARPGRTRTAAGAVSPGHRSRFRWFRHIGLFALAVPVAAAAATLFSLALSALLPWSELNRLVAAVFLMPVLWGAGAAWVCGDRRTLRPAAALVVSGGLSGLALFAAGPA